jgi:hypothetical protein
MGRTTNIVISTNPKTKTRQTQTIWFGDGQIRLNGETGIYIGDYAKDGGGWNAVLIFKDDTSLLRLSVQSISPPLTTATQAAQAVAWAWHACKALEGFAAAAAPVLELMEEDYWQEGQATIAKIQDALAYGIAEREAQAEATLQEYRAKGGWWYIVTAKNNYLVFNAAEERAFYTTQEGELLREVEAREEVDYALTCWRDSTIHPYTGEIWAYYFRAAFADSNMGNTEAYLFCKHVAFDELETPEQESAYLFISESEELDDIPEWAMQVDFHWKLTYLAAQDYFPQYEDDGSEGCKARRDEHRTIIADCK